MALTEIAKAALEEHLPLLRDGEYAKRYGWRVEMDWERDICLVRMSCNYGTRPQLAKHAYLLRLTFDVYPVDQPGVIFVNPEDPGCGWPADFQRWWPNIDGDPSLAVQINANDPSQSYLCFQWTHEFKKTHAALPNNDPKRWDPEKHNVVGVAATIQRALNGPHYKGYRKQA